MVTNEFLNPVRKAKFTLDRYPSIGNLNLPFSCFGSLPTHFDSPATWNPEQRKNFKWIADTFLTTFQLLSNKKEEIKWILGFCWGYEFYDDSSRPELLPLEKTAIDAWNRHLPFLKRESPNWKFKAGRRVGRNALTGSRKKTVG